MAWDEEALQEEIAEEFASFDHFVEEDEARGRQIVTQIRAQKRQIRRALNAIANNDTHKNKKRIAREGARRRRANKKVAPVGRPRLPRPSKRRVLALREQKLSWPAIARRLKCSEWIARIVAGAVKSSRVAVKA